MWLMRSLVMLSLTTHPSAHAHVRARSQTQLCTTCALMQPQCWHQPRQAPSGWPQVPLKAPLMPSDLPLQSMQTHKVGKGWQSRPIFGGHVSWWGACHVYCNCCTSRLLGPNPISCHHNLRSCRTQGPSGAIGCNSPQLFKVCAHLVEEEEPLVVWANSHWWFGPTAATLWENSANGQSHEPSHPPTPNLLPGARIRRRQWQQLRRQLGGSGGGAARRNYTQCSTK